jgi:trimeric autotransporter adhesin
MPFRRSVRAAFLSLVSFAISSCGEIPTATNSKVGGDALLAPAASQQGLVVTPANNTILVGQNLTLTVKNSNGSAINKAATWTSSNPSVATVVSTGTGTARVTGVGSGTVTITATSSNKSGSTSVSVVPVPVRFVTLSPDSARVEVGDQVQYTAVPRDSAGNALAGRVVTWSVTDFGVATIDNNGLATTNGRGSTRVIATSEGVSDTTWLISQQTPTRIEVFEKSILFDALGETKQLIASVYDTKNHLITDAVVTWGSSDTQIATVNSSGVVTPQTTAQSAWTFVSASLGTLADTATVTVYRIAASVVASPDTMVINALTQPGEVGGQFTATMYDRNGFVITAGPGAWVLWESLDTMIASVDMLTGNVTASTNGTARIVAHSFTGTQDTVVVVVDAPPTAPRLISSSPDAESSPDTLVATVKPWRRHWAQ